MTGIRSPGEQLARSACGPGWTSWVDVDDVVVIVGGGGGMSVAPDCPGHLSEHRRPAEHGGTGKDPVWELDVADLGSPLV